MTGPFPNSPYQYQTGQLYVDQVPLAAIATGAGTPVYVYSLRHSLQQYERLRQVFAPLSPDFHYSIKANGSGAIIRALVEAGCGCDAVSAGEIHMAQRAGCPPERIVFAGVGKTRAEITYALQHNTGWLNVENAGELALVNTIAGEFGRQSVRVALRVNPALQADTHQHIATGHEGAKFGIPLEEARALLENRAVYPHLDIAGLHVHIGSQLGRPDESAAAARVVLALAQEFGLAHLNLGGGFPVQYDGAPPAPIEEFAAALLPVLQNQAVQIAFEPGRFLVAEAGALVAEVQYIKNNGRTVVLNAGMTDLLRPALYGAKHPVWPLLESGQPGAAVQVVGPICESADVMHPAAMLPPLKPGDLVAVGSAGAYGMSMASNYNGRPRPAEALVEGAAWHIIRRRETFEDLVRLEAT